VSVRTWQVWTDSIAANALPNEIYEQLRDKPGSLSTAENHDHTAAVIINTHNEY
jgi:Na+/H+-translocating membrane pyrophosphatase